MDNLVNVVVGAVVDALLSQGRQSTPKLTLHLILPCGVVFKVIVISMLRAY